MLGLPLRYREEQGWNTAIVRSEFRAGMSIPPAKNGMITAINRRFTAFV
jgi:hypothetical protein